MTAYFVFRPRTFRDLRRPHLLKKEHEFRIVKTITLSCIDYENFSEDLLVDRSLLRTTPTCVVKALCCAVFW